MSHKAYLICLVLVCVMCGCSSGSPVSSELASSRNVNIAVLQAQTIKKAVELYINIDGADGCPKLDDLVNARKLDKDHSNDPWGTPYRIQCPKPDEVHVLSAGKDKKDGTPDDVREDFTKADIERVAKL